ncbi:sensor histidine kinase [Cryptosporangium minutisporangium]|uniref:histidine kinase n=1 Tax=Cryptosporangium minutisporangium TaxID=113569 RepID=A0ABP6SYK4_9ACTN
MVLSVLAVVVVAGAVVGAVMLQRTAVTSNRLADRISPASTGVQQLVTALADQDGGLRGYLTTGDRQFLAQYQAGRRAEQETVARLRILLGSEPELLTRIDQAEAMADRWRARFAAGPLAGPATTGRGVSNVAEVVEAGRGSQEIRTVLSRLSRDLQNARDAARSDLNTARAIRDATFITILVTVLVGGVLMMLLLRTVVLKPLSRLRAEVRAVSAGDFERVIVGHGPADLVELADDVEVMRRRITGQLRATAEVRARLEAQTEELSRSNAELEQFAYVASHDLQEPLRKVASFCQLLENRYGDVLDERGRKYISFAVDGAHRMQSLIVDLLTFSRVGRVHDKVRELDLDEALDRALSNLARSVRDSGATIHREPLPRVTGEPTQLTMLFQNLLGNALKFRRPDTPPVISVACSAVDDGWQITVTDNGIGIEAQYADRIFVLFQRLHTRDAYDGTGIGLAVCRKVVDYHGGRIWLDADYHDGTRIHLTLPAAQSGDSGAADAGDDSDLAAVPAAHQSPS